MAAPTLYTEATLKAFMHAVLSSVATALGWSVAEGDYDEAVNEALLAYGVDDVADAADIAKLRTLARREAWRAVVAATAGDFDFRADGGQFSRSQFHKQAEAEYLRAMVDALPYDDGWAVEVATLEPDYDPYAVPED